jgi:hypothetical protein
MEMTNLFICCVLVLAELMGAVLVSPVFLVLLALHATIFFYFYNLGTQNMN